MPYYRAVGDVPRKRHTIARRGGNVLARGAHGHRGLLQRLRPALPPALAVGHRRRPRRVRRPRGTFTAQRPAPAPPPPHDRGGRGGDAGRRCWATTTSWSTIARVVGETELYRNAGGDELVYVQSGQAVLASVFGRLAVGPGDYVVIPTSTTHRWEVASDGEPLVALVIESSGHVAPPRKYLSRERPVPRARARTASATSGLRASPSWRRARASTCSCGTGPG